MNIYHIFQFTTIQHSVKSRLQFQHTLLPEFFNVMIEQRE